MSKNLVNDRVVAEKLDNCIHLAMALHPSILAWKIPWTKEPGIVQEVAKSRTRLHFHSLYIKIQTA